MSAATDIDWVTKPAIQTAPAEHLCSVIERGDIEETVHSSAITIHDSGIKLDGRKNRPRLVEIIAVGPGRWCQGLRQPAEVSVGQIVYVKERTIPFRMHLRKQNHFFIPMDGVMAELDRVNVRLKPLGNYVMTQEVDERARVAIMGSLPFHVGKTLGLDKKGEEADDIGCNKTRIEEVVAVGPGEFGGYLPSLRRGDLSKGEPEWVMAQEAWYKTPDVKPGDLIAFSDMARPCEVTLAGRRYTFFTLDYRVCTVLDR